jgi:nitroreductase
MIEPILRRRSIRKYTSEPVSDGDIRALLDAGMAGPSASNKKPWHFIVVTERETLNALAGIGTYWKMLMEAPLAIIVLGDPEISDRYWVQDCSAAAENVLLAATMLGLGGVWLGCHPNPDRVGPVRELLAIPEGIEPLAVLSLGHPDEEKEPRTQYEETRVHREGW